MWFHLLSFSRWKYVLNWIFSLEASKSYLVEGKICRELLQFKQKELAFILWRYYSDYELSMLVHTLSKYTDSFQYFVLKNHDKVKTVEEFAELGGYTVTTFRRIFTSVFHQPVYEWMQERRKEGILYELRHTNFTISEICYKYGFESLSHFSNFCKKNFGLSPRNLRKEVEKPSFICTPGFYVFVCLTCLGYQAGSIISYHKKNSSTGFPDRRVLVILIKCRKYG